MEEVKLAIKPYYQKKDITKEEYKDILRKAVHKVGHGVRGMWTGRGGGGQGLLGPLIRLADHSGSGLGGGDSGTPGSPDLPQQKWGNQPREGEQPGAGLRPALPLLPQARPQARGSPRTTPATQGARAPRQGWPRLAPAPSMRPWPLLLPLASEILDVFMAPPPYCPRQWNDWGRVALGKRRAPYPALAQPLRAPSLCPSLFSCLCPSLQFH